MKNLANCKPSEFIKQTNRIKKSVEKWMKAVDIINIRRNAPKLKEVPLDADVETKAEIFAENKRLMTEQGLKNTSRILDAMLEEHPDETLELLALVCFIEPKDADNHSMREYLTAITEMMNDEAVIGFFTSLAKWGLTSTSDA